MEGHSLAQTVFTNLYLHDPNLVEDPTLRAFCVCMLKIVDLIRDRINRAGVYEEVSLRLDSLKKEAFNFYELHKCFLIHFL